MRSIWSKNEIDFLQKHYFDMGGVWCSEYLVKTPKQINNKASKLGIKVNQHVKIAAQAIRATGVRKSKVVAHTLTHPTTIESAYILGLLWADSYIHKNKPIIRIEMIFEDLNELIPIFNTSGKWCQAVRTRAGRKKQLILVTSNPELWTALKGWSYLERHVGAEFLLKEMKDSLKPSFFRGLVDGDGCFYINQENKAYQFSLAGSYHQNWDFVTSLLDELGIKWSIQRRIQKRKNKPETSSSTVRITNMKDIVKLGDYIYDSKDYCLIRKYNKYQEIKKISSRYDGLMM